MKNIAIIFLFALQFSWINPVLGQNPVYPILKENQHWVEFVRVLSLIQKSDLKGLDTISIGQIIANNDERTGLQTRIFSKKNYLLAEIHQYNEALEASRVQELIDRSTSSDDLEKALAGPTCLMTRSAQISLPRSFVRIRISRSGRKMTNMTVSNFPG